MISVACINGPERVKDTTNNVKTGNGFTVNIISVPFVEQANACSINAPQEIGEWPVSGLTKEPSVCGIIFMKFDAELIPGVYSAASRKGSPCERERV
jgi:flavin reductase (DIM6/NTAB) family NADH-FMN oxidoreductase RutF